MAEISKLSLEIESQKVKEAATNLDKMAESGNEAAKSGTTVSSTFAKLRDVMQGPVAAAKMVIDGFKKIKAVSDEMEDAWKTQERAVSNLESVLKATGGAAGLTSKELQDMASGLQKVTATGDETIIAAQSIMLTFREIGKDVFPGAIEAAMDMAQVFGGDLNMKVMQLGKALNDPIQGVSALTRVGIQFTDKQKAMIESLMATNDIAGAQGIIMDEVTKQVGGAARAAGETASVLKDKLANAISDVNEQIGRSISNNLAPWRLAWIELAEGITAALTASNDFRDAMKLQNTQLETLESKLVIAEQKLKTYNSELKSTRLSERADLQKRIDAEIAIIAHLQEQIRLRDSYAQQSATTAAATKAAEDAEQAKIDGRIAALKTTADGIRELTRQENQRLISADEAAEKIKELYKTELWELDKLGYKIGDTTTIGGRRMDELADRLGMLGGAFHTVGEASENTAKSIQDDVAKSTTWAMDALEEQAVAADKAGEETLKEWAVNEEKKKKIEQDRIYEGLALLEEQTLASYAEGEKTLAAQNAFAEEWVKIERNRFAESQELLEKSQAASWQAGQVQYAADKKAEYDYQMYLLELREKENEASWKAGQDKLKQDEQADEQVLARLRERTAEELTIYQAYLDAKEAAEMAVAERLADAQERAYASMGKTFADSMLEGEGLWKSFARAGTEALASVIEAYALEFGLLAAKALIPGLGFNPAAAAGYLALSAAAYMTAGTVRAIPMAEGGSGTVDKPTLFLAGEAGKEDFDFSPHSKGGRKGGVTIIQNIAGSIWTTQQLQSLAVGAVQHEGRGF